MIKQGHNKEGENGMVLRFLFQQKNNNTKDVGIILLIKNTNMICGVVFVSSVDSPFPIDLNVIRFGGFGFPLKRYRTISVRPNFL